MPRQVVIMASHILPGDATGHDILGMYEALKNNNEFTPSIYGAHVYTNFQNLSVPKAKLQTIINDPESILIYHYTNYWEEGFEILKAAKCKTRIMRYHNVTPARFFTQYNQDFVNMLLKARYKLKEFTDLCNWFFVPSFYDARGIYASNVFAEKIHHIPIFHKLADFATVKSDKDTVEKLQQDKRFKLLFLGRLSPNKGHKHLIEVIRRYVTVYGDNVVLYIVGGKDDSIQAYYDELNLLVKQYKLEQNVIFEGTKPFAAIASYYANIDAFLCLSEHEGFCVPIIEAQYFAKPVIGYYCGGVPEAAGNQQLLFQTLDYNVYVAAIEQLRTNKSLYTQLAQQAQAHVTQQYAINYIQDRFLTVLNGIK